MWNLQLIEVDPTSKIDFPNNQKHRTFNQVKINKKINKWAAAAAGSSSICFFTLKFPR